jgi:hypothetical protein
MDSYRAYMWGAREFLDYYALPGRSLEQTDDNTILLMHI